MARAGDMAKQLGQDASLPAVSVNDAAAAMTELAKGGLTLQESMTASKGTLQLATAAGVSAQQAATIQADSLNTFQLGADQANRVADLLANAANASSGEITDFAQGLAQAGSVAAGFGVPIEDTVTSLAMFAKMGVKGSDAGTMLKTSLQAITDGGEPAQAAIKELGLELYDANEEFVGYPEMIKQVAAASERMSDKQFQAATATLFGSDAMRASMIAANGGADAFDALAAEVQRVGGAAEVSAAKTKGLPGAWERVKGALEGVQLQAYDLVDGPLAGLADTVTAGLNSLGNAGDSSTFQKIADAVKEAAPGLGDIAVSLGKAAGTIGGAAWGVFTTALEAAAAALKILAPLLRSVGDFMRDNQTLVTTFVAAFAGFKFLPAALSPVTTALGNLTTKAKGVKGGVANMADSWKTMVGYLQQSRPELSKTEARLTLLRDGAKGVATNGFGAMKSGIGNLVGALGGPLNIALMAGGAAFGYIATENAKATAAAATHKATVEEEATSQRDLTTALLGTAGAWDEVTNAEARNRVKEAVEELGTPTAAPSFADGFRDANGSLLGGILGDWGAPTKESVMNDAAKLRADAAAAIKTLVPDEGALTDQIKGDQAQFDALVTSLQNQGEAGQLAATKLRETRAAIVEATESAATAAPVLSRMGDGTKQSAEQLESFASKVRVAFEAVPKDVPIRVDTPNGALVLETLQKLKADVEVIPDTKEIAIDAPASQEVIAALEAIGVLVREDNGKLIIVEQEGAEEAGAEIDEEANRPRTAWIDVVTRGQVAAIEGGAALGVDADPNLIEREGIRPRAEGAIVPGSGMRKIDKPDQADIYDGVGAGTVFAERETGGEAYIPLAPGKRGRSTEILAEVARLFGLSLSAPTGASGGTVNVGGGGGDLITSLSTAVTAPIVSALEQLRSALASSSSPRYSSGSPLPVSMAGGFDAALLSRVPSGTYSQTQAADLTKGLGDCSSAVEDLVNLMDGMPTAGRSMATGNAAEWLTSRGFKSGLKDGAFNVAFNDTHMQATLPDGTPFNWGSDAAAAAGGVGGLGAMDPGLTQRYYRDVNATWETLAQSGNDLTAAMEGRTTAEQALTDANATEAEQADSGGSEGSSLGQSFVSGMLEAIGLDGSVFSNPFEWSNVKSGMALANWGGGLLKGVMGGGQEDGATGVGGGMAGGALGGIGLPNIADFLKPLPGGSIEPARMPDAPHQGGGQPPGPSVVVNGNVGMDPRQFTQRVDSKQNQAYRQHITAVRPG